MTFIPVKETRLPNGTKLKEFAHEKTGAQWYHLDDGKEEKVFMVGVTTLPESDNGIPHILEHLALCGSRKYPVRDPFFNMLRRSLATFMNAMTYPDRTVYPFSTIGDKDFRNLLGVYLDAVFFPKLDKFDFMQEGWRLEHDGEGLSIKGIVFNEMKGALSDASAVLWRSASRKLFDGSTYQWEYGGDPLATPGLTHEELLDFHRKHYHPSNATFMTAGNIDLAEVFSYVEKEVMEHFDGKGERFRPQVPASPFTGTTQTIDIPSAGDGDENQYLKTWRIDEAVDGWTTLKYRYLSELLLGSNSSPFMSALENAGFGLPGNILGFDEDGACPTFWLGMGGLKREEIGAARKLIDDTLNMIANEGFSAEAEIAAFDQFELHSLEAESGRTPYSMTLLFSGMGASINGQDVAEAMDKSAGLDRLRLRIAEGGFGKELVRSLLDSGNFVETEAFTVDDWADRQQKEEKKLVERMSEGIDEEGLDRIRTDAETLRARQGEKQNVDILPSLSIADIPKKPTTTPKLSLSGGVACVPADTNNVLYVGLSAIPAGMSDDELRWLSLAATFANQVGVGKRDYISAAAWHDSLMSRFSTDISIANDIHGGTSLRTEFSAAMVGRKGIEGIEAMIETFHGVRFDEIDRWKYLVADLRQSVESSLVQSGLSYASNEALSCFSEASRLRSLLLTGKEALFFIRHIERLSQSKEGLSEIMDKCRTAWMHMLSCRKEASLIGDTSPFVDTIGKFVSDSDEQKTIGGAGTGRSVALVTKSPIAFCTTAYPLQGRDNQDIALLSVASAAMTNGFLHRAIREEGGAYGSSARVDQREGVFVLSSWRDPRVAGTLQDFDRAFDWFLNGGGSEREWNEAKLSVLQSDKPASPAAEAKKAIMRMRSSDSDENRQDMRDRIIGADVGEARAVIERLLDTAPARVAFCGEHQADEASGHGLSIVNLGD